MESYDTQFLCLLLLLLTFILFVFFLNSSKSRWPPSPPRLPIIGHLHILTDMPHHVFTKLSNQLGPIIHLQLGQVSTIIVSSPQLAKLVLKTQDHVFASRPQLISAQYLSFGCSDVTFSPYGPYWRQARKICLTELLSSRRVNSFQHVRDEEVTQLLNTITKCANSGSEIDISNEFFTLANDVLCRVAFGRRLMEESAGERRRLMDVLTETQALFAGFCLGDFFPEWKWVNSVSGYKQRLTKNLKDLNAVCDEIIDEHVKKEAKIRISGAGGGGDGGEDFVDVLLRVQRKNEGLEVPITNDNLKALVLDMFVAGTDTTSATLEWTMTELVRHPRVMNKVQQEVRGVASEVGRIEEGYLHHLYYMRCVIKETMRLHPPVPLLVP